MTLPSDDDFEGIICTAEPHWIRLWSVYAAMVIAVAISIFVLGPATGSTRDVILVLLTCTLILLGGAGFLVFKRFMGRFDVMAVTDCYIVHKKGIFSQRVRHLPLDTTIAIDVERSLVGRIFGYGDVAVHHDGEAWARVRRIKNPSEFQNAVKRLAPNPRSPSKH
ncbi:PH domain-containing protein [Palleronia rufa]|uniref:PH domain-containing protein n=1 Tax=Palleronia rufa TaxID=1530186 RepID=UPI00055E338F|nr:PH domain-containing protein [Palleronia rufa]